MEGTGVLAGEVCTAGLSSLGALTLLMSAHVMAAERVLVTLFNPTNKSVDVGAGRRAVVAGDGRPHAGVGLDEKHHRAADGDPGEPGGRRVGMERHGHARGRQLCAGT